MTTTTLPSVAERVATLRTRATRIREISALSQDYGQAMEHKLYADALLYIAHETDGPASELAKAALSMQDADTPAADPRGAS